MSHKKEILIIEDTLFGKSYRNLLIKTNPDWNVTCIDSLEGLKAFDKLEQLHVFVFDQRLQNGELGTEAFKYVHKKNPLVQGVMLSGVALAYDLEELRREVAPSVVLYLHKKNIDLLPEYVRNAVEGYYLNVTLNRNWHEENKILSGKRWGLRLTRKPQITLLRYYIVDENYVFEDSWVSARKIRAGEERTEIEVFKYTISDTIVSETQYGVNANASEKTDIIQKAIESYFKKNIKREQSSTVEYQHTVQIEGKMPAFPSSPDNPTIALTYQNANAYRHIRVAVSCKCYCCNNTSYSEYDVFIPRQLIKERAVIAPLNGPRQIIEISENAKNN